jgi:phosphoesterase RecJ-like protein
MKVSLQQAADFFREHDNYTLLCHASPDGDTLGSGYALCGVLHTMGKHARVVTPDEPSPRFDFLRECVDVRLLGHNNAKETVVTVDVADVELLAELKQTYFRKIDFCIDHHISNKNFAPLILLDTEAAACAEVVWELIKELSGRELGAKITPMTAGAIYTGISTDTGCFRYSNTTAKSHTIAAELMAYGFDVSRINYLMFEMKTRERVLLEQQALAGIEYYFGDKCAVIILTADMIAGIDSEDASNVSGLPKQIEGVEVGVVLKEKSSGGGDSKWKISVRTSPEVNAQAICAELGGGGHIRAAGCTLRGEVGAVKGAILREVERQLICTE